MGKSFEKLNYSTRPNKNVERKLIAQLLGLLGSKGYFDVKSYQYIGFGSIWFTDFSLIHRVIGIKDMTSVEKESSREQRLRFNKPFECITLVLREYSDALADLDWQKRSVVWLDYDDILKPGMFDDLKRTISKVVSGSVVLVSVNADAQQLQHVKQEDQELSEAEALRLVVGSENLPADHEKRLGRAKFPSLVGDILDGAFKTNTTTSRADLEFVPLLSVTYADGVPMVTYGGIFLNPADLVEFNKLPLQTLDFPVGSQQFELAVPNLTPKEKMRFDQLLPRSEMPTSKDLGFELRENEIKAYVKFYLHYPVYGEYQF
jgi:hypothetical protein